MLDERAQQTWVPRGHAAQVTLNNGVAMPLVGFGTAALGETTMEAVLAALAAGYRLVDSAQVCLLLARPPIFAAGRGPPDRAFCNAPVSTCAVKEGVLCSACLWALSSRAETGSAVARPRPCMAGLRRSGG